MWTQTSTHGPLNGDDTRIQVRRLRRPHPSPPTSENNAPIQAQTDEWLGPYTYAALGWISGAWIYIHKPEHFIFWAIAAAIVGYSVPPRYPLYSGIAVSLAYLIAKNYHLI